MKPIYGANTRDIPPNLIQRLQHKWFTYRTGANRHSRAMLQLCDPSVIPQEYMVDHDLATMTLKPLTEPLAVRVSGRGADGKLLREDDRSTVWELFYYRVYDSELPAMHWRTVLDVGANAGLFMVFLRWVGVPLERYVGVEPDPDNFRVLCKQVELQRMQRKSKLWQVAASNDHGIHRFSNTQLSILRTLSDDGEIEVQSMPLLDIINQSGLDQVDLLKLDIEGGERLVMQLAKDWAPRVKRIATELHEEMDVDWLRKNLQPLGFRVFDEGVLFRDVHGAIREDLIDEVPRHLR